MVIVSVLFPSKIITIDLMEKTLLKTSYAFPQSENNLRIQFRCVNFLDVFSP